MPKIPPFADGDPNRFVDYIIQVNEQASQWLATKDPKALKRLTKKGLGSFAYVARAQFGKRQTVLMLERLITAIKQVE